jgi:CheY-like chemotaxis protein
MAPPRRAPGKGQMKRSGDAAPTRPVRSPNAGADGNASAAFPSRTSSPATAVSEAATRPSRILLAEDSPDNRLLITAFLKCRPYQIDAVENGKVAVEKFSSGQYDLVLMDIHMPVIDGYTAVRAIRAWETGHRVPATPILALTASTLDDDIRRAFDAGCNTYIAKPVRRATLLAAIDETLALVLEEASGRRRAAAASQPAHPRVSGIAH